MKMVITSVADIWTEPSTESERDSQVIYGESVEVLEDLGQFVKVRSIDGVTGFVKSALLGEWSERHYKLSRQVRNERMSFPFGSYVSEKEVEIFKIPRRYLHPIEETFDPVVLTRKFMGVPYLWGGTSDFGFDCSGFTQRLFRFSGTEIPRNSGQQRDASETVKDFESAIPGDLVFFKGHVAFYLGKGKIIHANGHFSRVTETDLFDQSAYSKELLGVLEKIGRFKPNHK
ncbi:MAG: SH3 domain-containing C40 family peptidase [Candidatus Parvarchaeota archaeon]